MIKLIEKIKYHIKHNYLDATREKDLADEAAENEKDMLIALKDAEIKDLRAQVRELKKIRK